MLQGPSKGQDFGCSGSDLRLEIARQICYLKEAYVFTLFVFPCLQLGVPAAALYIPYEPEDKEGLKIGLRLADLGNNSLLSPSTWKVVKMKRGLWNTCKVFFSTLLS